MLSAVEGADDPLGQENNHKDDGHAQYEQTVIVKHPQQLVSDHDHEDTEDRTGKTPHAAYRQHDHRHKEELRPQNLGRHHGHVVCIEPTADGSKERGQHKRQELVPPFIDTQRLGKFVHVPHRDEGKADATTQDQKIDDVDGQGANGEGNPKPGQLVDG